jgi:hypothetical protein
MMGKDKLGRRGKLFKSQFGEDFHPGQLVSMAIDTAKSKPKARTFDYFVEPLGESFFFTPDERGAQQLLSVANETLPNDERRAANITCRRSHQHRLFGSG